MRKIWVIFCNGSMVTAYVSRDRAFARIKELDYEYLQELKVSGKAVTQRKYHLHDVDLQEDSIETFDYGVKVNQIWMDWDIRFRFGIQRKFEVRSIIGEHAVCVNVSTGRETRILLRRMKPVANGYKLVHDVE